MAMGLTTGARADEPAWVDYAGATGPGAGRSIVLVSGDEEYRSEEALPQLARILSVRHGFDCRVVFAIDPATGVIDPDVRTNIPGLEALDDADLMIIATRFRDLPDEQMKHIDAYLASGKPVVGMRTATHAFAIESSDTYRRYTWNNKDADFEQGFGRQVLGETWIAHHGQHGVESTRGVIAPGMEQHPIVRGLAPGDVWGPTDVYRVRLPLPDGCTPVVLGQVLAGMGFDDPPVGGEKNEPLMPIAWTRERGPDGWGPRRVFATTMGAATDLSAEGTRRMLVNGVYWALGMERQVDATGTDVDIVGTFRPTRFGFGGFRRGVRPRDHALPDGGTTADASLAPGARVVVVGNTFDERLAQSGVFDAVLHAAHPDHELVIRHVPWSADEVSRRPREVNVPTTLDWIERFDADVVVLCYGMSESFTMTPADFASRLGVLIDRIGDRRVVLVSPIAHETLDRHADLRARNAALAAITAAMARVARERGLPFVDLHAVSLDAERRGLGPLTTNGIHPNQRGAAVCAEAIARQLGWWNERDAGDGGSAADLLTLAADQHWLLRLLYRPTNTEYVWGRRHEPYGVVNFPPEEAQLERMIAARDGAIWRSPKPTPADVIAHALAAPPIWPATPSPRTLPEDTWSPAPVEAKGTETSLGSVNIAAPDAFAESFTLPADYVVECFASEQDVPELADPLAMTFDDRGRLWVLCTPTYPHLLPGERPRCKLLILEDGDGDGRVDRRTVFADGLYIPTGFEIDGDGVVYLGQAPDLLCLTDTDGDDRVDTTEIIASGFGMCDSHHQVSAFEWDPAGGLLFCEGVFTKSNVETPFGTRRTRDAAVWRFDPRSGRIEVVSHCNFSNPWGHAFDDFGASVLADASGGDNHSFTHVSAPSEYPHKPRAPHRISNRGRPTAGCEIISSRHFPDDVQGTFLVNQSIGFHGVRWDRLTWEGSTWATEAMPADLLSSSDVNFRPVGMEVGPDGALYVLDWCNPIVGHMQYSIRDPRRDHTHGRVWRIRHRGRPLVERVDVHDASAAELLAMLELPERNTRARARLRLQRMAWPRVGAALATWRGRLDPAGPAYDRLLLEDLWIRHAHGRADAAVFERVMGRDEPRVRAAAARVLRFQLQADEIATHAALPLVAAAVDDPDMRVRLEGVLACGFLPPADGVRLAARADLHAMDEAMTVVFEEVLAYLGRGGDVVSDVLDRVRMAGMPAEELLALPLDETTVVARLSRDDLPADARTEALVHLAGDDVSGQATHLIALLESSRGETTLRSLGALLLALPPEALANERAAGRRLAADDDPVRRAVGTGMLLDVDGGSGDSPERLIDAVTLMPPGRVPADTLAALRTAAENGDVDAWVAVEQIARHDRDKASLYPWLIELADGAQGDALHAWTAEHERAMAAMAVMSRAEHAPIFGRFGVEAAAPAVLAAGHAIYHDEILGCVRCHGPEGEGLEGYPRLARSPWVVGAPARAASIVVHGLFGPLELPDGRSYNSAMEPLGGILDDEQVATVLTYVRQSWGNFAPPVTAADVAVARAAGPEQGGMWATAAITRRYPLYADVLVAAPEEATNVAAIIVGRTLLLLGPPILVVVLLILALERRNATA